MATEISDTNWDKEQKAEAQSWGGNNYGLAWLASDNSTVGLEVLADHRTAN